MPFVSEVGDADLRELTFEWNIRDFFSLSDTEGDCYLSPHFRFADTHWYLRLYPNGYDKQSSGFVSLYLDRKDKGKRGTIKYNFGFKRSDGLEEKKKREFEFSNEDLSRGLPKCWTRSVLRKKISNLPDNVFTITCHLKCEDANVAKVLRSHRVFEMSRDMGAILEGGKRSDFTLKLGDRDWPVHKVILESRCEYFANMFRHDWVENEVGEVKFDDMEEDTLDSVLRFVYTGDVEDMCVKNVCPIYVAAHKFILDELKALCVEYMKSDMCKDILCEVLVIAKTYEKKDLYERAFEYFEEDPKKILDTEEWKELKKNHSSIVADLLEEAFRREVEKRTK